MGWIGIIIFPKDVTMFKKLQEKRLKSNNPLDEIPEQMENENSENEKEDEINLKERKRLSALKRKQPVSIGKEEDQKKGYRFPVIILRLLIVGSCAYIGFFSLLFMDAGDIADPELLRIYNVDVLENQDYATIDYITLGGWQYPLGRFLLNFVLLPIYIAFLPFLFLYLARKESGIQKVSYYYTFFGFILYMGGRIAQGVYDAFEMYAMEAIVPPLLILTSLAVLYWANHYPKLMKKSDIT
jgi:hypothetical protein